MNDSTDDGRPWGFLDEDGAWILLPKQPLLLAGLGPPPFFVTLPDGRVRHVVHRPANQHLPAGDEGA